MSLCKKCHTNMSKKRLNIHKHTCVGEYTKGHNHFIECRSHYKPKMNNLELRR